MKRIGNLYDKISSLENVREVIKNAAKGKTNRTEVQTALDDFESNAAALSSMLQAKAFKPQPYAVRIVYEGSKNKRRIIHKPQFWPDQCAHWAIYNVIGPIIYNGLYGLSCASVPGRGVHYGKCAINKWLRDDCKNTKYYLKLDIHHYYPSISIPMLKQQLRRKFKDADLLALLDAILDMDDGLPIGMLLSQLFANFVLTPVDNYIKQQLGAVHYIRYMDDMVIFGRNKKQLHKMRTAIAERLGEIGLELKGNWQVCRFDADPLDFMGFRFYRDKTTLRREIMLRITRKVRRVDKKGHMATAKDAAGVISYLGWIHHTDSHALFEKWVKPYLHIQRLKNIIKKEAKKNENQQNRKHGAPAGMGFGQQPGCCLPQH